MLPHDEGEKVTGKLERLWAGLDLGGTGTRAVLVNDQGVEIAGETVPTSSFGAHALDRLAPLVEGLVPAGGVLAGVGIGASGPVDLVTGAIRNPDTLPQFTGVDVAGGLSERLEVQTWIDNDAVVAGLAEDAWGTAAGAPSILCVTLGTGVGVVLIHDGHPLRAADGQHAEGGHIPVPGQGNPCYCGLDQCWEQVASRTALDQLQSSSGGTSNEVWEYYGACVAGGLVTLVTLYHPAAIVIGGSVAQHWQNLERPLRNALARSREFDPHLWLGPSQLGERAGALGATLLAMRGIGWSPGVGTMPDLGERSTHQNRP